MHGGRLRVAIAASIDFGGDESFADIALAPDGKIVAAGTTDKEVNPGDGTA